MRLNPFKKKSNRGGMSKFKAGSIAIAVIVIFTYLGFTKFKIPFVHGYQAYAVFSNANQLRPGSFIREDGINVGQVKQINPVSSCSGVQPCSAADVTMDIFSNGLPIHKDATFNIRPRIFLEGNFFIDLHPGSPSAPVAPSGYTFPIQAGTEPVQFDQVLTSLQSDTRHNLQVLLEQYGTASKKSASSLNRGVQYMQPAFQYTSAVSHDALGLQQHDLSGYIDQGGTVAAATDQKPALENLVTDFNTTAHALAIQQANLQSAVAELPHTLSVAIPAFNALNAAFPPVRELARKLVPGVVSTGQMIPVTLPLIGQLRQLVQPSELQGLSNDLRFTIPALAKLTKQTIPLLRNQVRPASSCSANIIYPWSQLTIPDAHFNAANGFPNRKVFQEQVDFLPGLAGESRNFDANGPYVRVGISAGASLTYSLSNGFFGQTLEPLEGAQPSLPPGGNRPPIAGGDIPNYPCETQAPISTLAAPETTGPKPSPNILPGGTLTNPLGLTLSKSPSSSSAKSSNSASAKSSNAAAAKSSNASTAKSSNATASKTSSTGASKP